MKHLATLALLLLALPCFAPQFAPHPLIKNLPGQMTPNVIPPMPGRIPLLQSKSAQAAAARLTIRKTMAAMVPPMPFTTVVPNPLPICFQFYMDEEPQSQPPFPAYTNFSAFWNGLSNGTYYYFQTSKNLTTWVTREEGLWTGNYDDYFGLDLPKTYNVMEMQRAFGTNPPTRAAGLVQPAAIPMQVLKVRHKGEPYTNAVGRVVKVKTP